MRSLHDQEKTIVSAESAWTTEVVLWFKANAKFVRWRAFRDPRCWFLVKSRSWNALGEFCIWRIAKLLAGTRVSTARCIVRRSITRLWWRSISNALLESNQRVNLNGGELNQTFCQMVRYEQRVEETFPFLSFFIAREINWRINDPPPAYLNRSWPIFREVNSLERL